MRWAWSLQSLKLHLIFLVAIFVSVERSVESVVCWAAMVVDYNSGCCRVNMQCQEKGEPQCWGGSGLDAVWHSSRVRRGKEEAPGQRSECGGTCDSAPAMSRFGPGLELYTMTQ